MSRLLRGARELFLRKPSFPTILTLRDFDRAGVRFEVSNPVEWHRVARHGDETEYTKEMLASLRPPDCLWDVGCCVGLVALHAAGTCRVVAFEPDPDFRSRVSRNLQLNPNRDFPVHPYAIGESIGTLTLHTDGVAGNSPSLRRQRGEQGRVEVEVRTIDSLVAAGFPAPTVMKLDIEGAEIFALRGAEETLRDRPPRLLFLEVHHDFLPAFGSSSDEVLHLIERAGYEPTYVAERAGQTHYIFSHYGS